MPNRRPPPRRNEGRPNQGGPKRKPFGRKPRPQAPAPRKTDADHGEEQGERLQKFLAHAGVGSRRACEELILQGRVSVDGEVVRELGTRVDPERQRVDVDGQRVRAERPVYFAVNKPKGYVSTNNDPAGRPRVIDLLPEVPERVYSVGRLDEQSTGLMILTNDGELANKLAHPKFGVEKVYRALVAGTPTREVLDKLVEGVWLAEGKARARRVWVAAKRGDATVLEMTLAEGKNREVRRMLAKLGHKVMSLTRIAVGPIGLRGLKPGQFRPLTFQEVNQLRRIAAGESVPTAGSQRREDRRAPRARRPGPPPVGGPAPRGPARPGRSHGPEGGPPLGAPPAGPRRRAGGPGPGPARRPVGSGPGPARRAGGPRPPRPEGGPRREPPAPPLSQPEPRRRIIGLTPEQGEPLGGGPRRRRPGPKRPGGPPPRRKAPMLKRPRRPKPGEEE